MAALNKVMLIGNLTRNPELRFTPSGSAVTDFTLAVNRTYTSNGEKKEEVCFVDIVAWGKQAETISKYLQKGSPMYLEGRLQLDRWEDKESGQKRSKMRVVAENFQFLGGPKDGGMPQEPYSPQSNSQQASPSYNAAPRPYVANNAPNVAPPPSMPMPTPAPQQAATTQPQSNAFSAPAPQTAPQAAPQAAPQTAPQAPHPAGGFQQPAPVAPPTGAFDTTAASEDDIPF